MSTVGVKSRMRNGIRRLYTGRRDVESHRQGKHGRVVDDGPEVYGVGGLE